jgi:F420-non-reducing hydrogenase iron-sulfur subunit
MPGALQGASLSERAKAERKGKIIMTAEFEPKIITFACNWCAYSAADLAGVSRLQYPPNMKIIRVMCSGRVNPNFILKAFQLGADGVLVAG